MQELLNIENDVWQALSTSEAASRNLLQTVLHEDATMLFPGGMRVRGKSNILASISSQPWSSFVIEQPQVISVAEHVGILAYRVNAKREKGKSYKALISSTYVQLKNKWKMIFHQQTPE